jgi:hypothetical protein
MPSHEREPSFEIALYYSCALVERVLPSVPLGNNRWSLMEASSSAFETAVSLGPEHAETHFNLKVLCQAGVRARRRVRSLATKALIPRLSDFLNKKIWGDRFLICTRGEVAQIFSQKIKIKREPQVRELRGGEGSPNQVSCGLFEGTVSSRHHYCAWPERDSGRRGLGLAA